MDWNVGIDPRRGPREFRRVEFSNSPAMVERRAWRREGDVWYYIANTFTCGEPEASRLKSAAVVTTTGTEKQETENRSKVKMQVLWKAAKRGRSCALDTSGIEPDTFRKAVKCEANVINQLHHVPMLLSGLPMRSGPHPCRTGPQLDVSCIYCGIHTVFKLAPSYLEVRRIVTRKGVERKKRWIVAKLGRGL